MLNAGEKNHLERVVNVAAMKSMLDTAQNIRKIHAGDDARSVADRSRHSNRCIKTYELTL